MKRIITAVIFLLINLNGFSQTLNIHDILTLNIPDAFQVFSITENFREHRSSNQYTLQVGIEYFYSGKRLFLIADLFGYGNKSKFEEIAEMLNIDKTGEYTPHYRTADQVKYLKNNFTNSPEKSENDIVFSREVTAWASGWSSDYFGIYFKIKNNYFSEVIIHSINYWDTFGGENLEYHDKDYRLKLSTLSEEGQQLFAHLDQIINSINVYPDRELLKHNDLIKLLPDSFPGYYIPRINNLRLRDEPSIEGNIIGYVKNIPYRLIEVGPSATFDDIKSSWYKIESVNGLESGWAFGGYIRSIKENELQNYFTDYIVF